MIMRTPTTVPFLAFKTAAGRVESPLRPCEQWACRYRVPDELALRSVANDTANRNQSKPCFVYSIMGVMTGPGPATEVRNDWTDRVAGRHAGLRYPSDSVVVIRRHSRRGQDR